MTFVAAAHALLTFLQQFEPLASRKLCKTVLQLVTTDHTTGRPNKSRGRRRNNFQPLSCLAKSGTLLLVCFNEGNVECIPGPVSRPWHSLHHCRAPGEMMNQIDLIHTPTGGAGISNGSSGMSPSSDRAENLPMHRLHRSGRSWNCGRKKTRNLH